ETVVKPGISEIDIGIGSGILSIGALKLDAGQALGVHLDNAAVISTKENAAANEVLDRLEVGLGSVSEVLAGQFSIRQAPLVVANILAPVIIRLFDAGLAELCLPGGEMVLSGILEDQAQGVIDAAAAKGLTFVELRKINDWVVILLRN
ncbi:MAG: 50S ribosomal protein L11 methyltransferase, partial [Anaerolineae bacterium]|nr:50S ribosomal protein L11 methyltransferase [Anaerolineae bacterium]